MKERLEPWEQPEECACASDLPCSIHDAILDGPAIEDLVDTQRLLKRYHDGLGEARKTIAEQATRIEQLEIALEKYRGAVRVDVLMEGLRFSGSNIQRLKEAWEHDRALTGLERKE